MDVSAAEELTVAAADVDADTPSVRDAVGVVLELAAEDALTVTAGVDEGVVFISSSEFVAVTVGVVGADPLTETAADCDGDAPSDTVELAVIVADDAPLGEIVAAALEDEDAPNVAVTVFDNEVVAEGVADGVATAERDGVAVVIAEALAVDAALALGVPEEEEVTAADAVAVGLTDAPTDIEKVAVPVADAADEPLAVAAGVVDADAPCVNDIVAA